MKKKPYSKPDIVFQNFRLSTDLCAACSIAASFAPNECPVTIPDFPFTLIGMENCEMYAPEESDTLCYHVPFADNSIFSS